MDVVGRAQRVAVLSLLLLVVLAGVGAIGYTWI